MINLMLVGLGPHARKCFYPIFFDYKEKWQTKIACGVEVENKKKEVEKFFSSQKSRIEMYYVKQSDVGKRSLRNTIKRDLKELVNKYQIKGVIIATEPLSHFAYSTWALDEGLNILLDKPITTTKNASLSLFSAKQLIKDYLYLLEKYCQAKSKNPNILFSVLCQRRYHKGINKIKKLINEVFERTNCPVTFIQLFHGDGQWRMPNEIIDLTYHGFNAGYGICSHSGYHLFDTLVFLIKGALKNEEKIDEVEVWANFLRPKDLLSQLNYKDYVNIFPEFFSYNRYPSEEYEKRVKNFGEVDAVIGLNFKNKGKILTIALINLFHNNLSQRGWLSCIGRDLYKGNGRIGHESYQIFQGPFQAIYCQSFKGEGKKEDNKER